MADDRKGSGVVETSDSVDVCVVGGAGHVGAPLAIVLASRGVRTRVYDIDPAATAMLADGHMPFLEHDAEPLLQRVLADETLSFTDHPSGVAGVPIVIITIGTPIDEFHNPRIEVITDCLDQLLPYMSDEQTIVLRSTVSPGVTDYVDRHLRARGRLTRVAFCPERVVQGHAIRELQTLPQIVSGTTPEAEEAAACLFARVAPKIVRMSPREAEFAKLISNAYRYIQFAAANQFYMMVASAGLDYAHILAGLKEDYERLRDLPGPGFAAGPCLMKDTMQLAAFNNNNFPLGNVAMSINEGLPSFLVDSLRRRRDLTRTRVGILGMAFKADTDDTRESLSYKLAKILRFHGAEVLCSDEYIADPTFVSKEQLVASSDVVIVGVPHHSYRSLRISANAEVVDLWGVVTAERPAAIGAAASSPAHRT